MSEAVRDAVWADHRQRQSSQIAAAALSLAVEGGATALTMAGIAKAADISRPTLYRYYPDLDAVLRGIADLVAGGDQALADLVAAQPDSRTAFTALAHAVASGHDHRDIDAGALDALLPPDAREVLAAHAGRVVALMAAVLRRGIAEGSVRSDIDPDADASLVLGLLTAADPAAPDRAVALASRLVLEPTTPTGGAPP